MNSVKGLPQVLAQAMVRALRRGHPTVLYPKSSLQEIGLLDRKRMATKFKNFDMNSDIDIKQGTFLAAVADRWCRHGSLFKEEPTGEKVKNEQRDAKTDQHDPFGKDVMVKNESIDCVVLVHERDDESCVLLFSFFWFHCHRDCASRDDGL